MVLPEHGLEKGLGQKICKSESKSKSLAGESKSKSESLLVESESESKSCKTGLESGLESESGLEYYKSASYSLFRRRWCLSPKAT